jgi:hypothetical protein
MLASMVRFLRHWWFLVLAAFVFILGVAGYIFFITSCAGISRFLVNKDIRDAWFLSADRSEATYFSNCGLSTLAYQQISFVELASTPHDVYALLREPTGTVDLYRVDVESPVLLTTDGVEKKHLSISPNGVHAVFASQTGDPGDATGGFELFLINLKDGTTTAIGTGGSATFVDNETIFYVSDTAYHTMNVITNESGSLADESAASIVGPIISGPNDTYLVKNPLIEEYQVFRVSSRVPVLIEPVRAFSGTYYGFYSSGGAFYALTRDSNGHQKIVREKEGITEAALSLPQKTPPLVLGQYI